MTRAAHLLLCGPVKELFAPLRGRAFRWLEGTGLFANTGVWMVTLVGGFIMERLTTSPVLVTFAAAMSPLAGILAVVFSGAAADSRDQRAVLLVAKILLASSCAFLVVMSSAQLLTPATLLLGLAGMGLSNGTSSPSWWTAIANLVPPELVPVAFSVDSFQWNIGQVVGPVLGGAVFEGRGNDRVFRPVWHGHAPSCRLLVAVAGKGRSAPFHAWRVGRRKSSRRRVIRLALLLEHPRAPRDFRSHGPVRDAGGGARCAASPLRRPLPTHHGLRLRVVPGAERDRRHVRSPCPPPPPGPLPSRRRRRGSDPHRRTRLGSARYLAHTDRRGTRSLAHRRVLGVGDGRLHHRRPPGNSRVGASTLFSLFYVVLQGPFVVGGLGFGVIDSFLPLRATLAVAAAAFIPGILLIPRFRLPVVDRSSLQLVASPSLSIGEHVHPDDGPVLILAEYLVDADEADDFLVAMAELRIVRRRLGGTRWGVFQDVTVPGRFLETFLVPSWQGYLLQRAHYSKGDLEVENRAVAFHKGPGGPKITRLVHPEAVEAARARSAWRWEMLRLLKLQLGDLASPASPSHQNDPREDDATSY